MNPSGYMSVEFIFSNTSIASSASQQTVVYHNNQYHHDSDEINIDFDNHMAARFVVIRITDSPSWVAWDSIRVWGPKESPTTLPPQRSLLPSKPPVRRPSKLPQASVATTTFPSSPKELRSSSAPSLKPVYKPSSIMVTGNPTSLTPSIKSSSTSIVISSGLPPSAYTSSSNWVARGYNPLNAFDLNCKETCGKI